VFRNIDSDSTPTYDSYQDGELLELALTGDQLAFEMLVKRYQRLLFRFTSGYFLDYDYCNDIVQQVMLQLYISLPDIHTQKRSDNYA
jgi:DNA-directed RNA polymerase specialized sigma24 family protein